MMSKAAGDNDYYLSYSDEWIPECLYGMTAHSIGAFSDGGMKVRLDPAFSSEIYRKPKEADDSTFTLLPTDFDLLAKQVKKFVFSNVSDEIFFTAWCNDGVYHMAKTGGTVDDVTWKCLDIALNDDDPDNFYCLGQEHAVWRVDRIDASAALVSPQGDDGAYWQYTSITTYRNELYGIDLDKKVWRIDPDSRTASQISPGEWKVEDVAFDRVFMYWTGLNNNGQPDSLYRMPKDGDPNDAPSPLSQWSLTSIAVDEDSGYIYATGSPQYSFRIATNADAWWQVPRLAALPPRTTTSLSSEAGVFSAMCAVSMLVFAFVVRSRGRGQGQQGQSEEQRSLAEALISGEQGLGVQTTDKTEL